MALDDGDNENGARLDALRRGDAAAIEAFVRENTPWMLRLANRMLRDQGLAEDTVQTAFASIFRALGKFEGRSSLKTWMHRIVANQALMQLRKARRLQETSIDALLPEFDASGCRVEEAWRIVETPEALLAKSQTK